MSFVRQHRLLVSVLITVVAVGTVAAVTAAQLLDPGDKDDRTTDLVTPTIAAETARVFDVAPDESRVDFVTRVGSFDLEGVFPIEEGTITLEPVGDELRVLVQLKINVDDVDTGRDPVDLVLRSGMETGDYPLAFYVASSTELVPVTEDIITFELVGELEVHNVTRTHSMSVEAQLVGGDMWAIATSDLDLSNHDVEFGALIGDTAIQLIAHLQSYEIDGIGAVTVSTPPAADTISGAP